MAFAGARQVRPDFSGIWIAVPPPPEPAGERRAPTRWGQVLTIQQTGDTLTIAYVSGSRAHAPVNLVFKLDGSESHNVDRNSTVPERTSRARWEDSALVVTTVVPRVERDGKPDPVEIVPRLRLESPDDLVIDIAQTVRGETLYGRARYRRR